MPGTTGSRRRGRPADPRPTIRRKNLNIDQQKLDRVVALLGASTETEAIDQALELLLVQEEALAGLRLLSGRGYEIENLFDEHLDL
jgi:hypothetical protein